MQTSNTQTETLSEKLAFCDGPSRFAFFTEQNSKALSKNICFYRKYFKIYLCLFFFTNQLNKYFLVISTCVVLKAEKKYLQLRKLMFGGESVHNNNMY